MHLKTIFLSLTVLLSLAAIVVGSLVLANPASSPTGPSGPTGPHFDALLLTNAADQILLDTNTTLSSQTTGSPVTLLFPTASDTLIGLNTTDSLTNKTLVNPAWFLSNTLLTTSIPTLDVTLSGTTYWVQSALSDLPIGLPSPQTGLFYRFVFVAVPSGTVTFHTNNALEVLYAFIVSNNTVMQIAKALSSIQIPQTAKIADAITFVSSDTSWFAQGFFQTALPTVVPP